jgi:hypothetical protein
VVTGGTPVEHLSSEREDDQRFRWSDVVWWACQDLNLGPHPYQGSTAERRASQHFARSRGSVSAVGMG